jgi:hypothetical protein
MSEDLKRLSLDFVSQGIEYFICLSITIDAKKNLNNIMLSSGWKQFGGYR